MLGLILEPPDSFSNSFGGQKSTVFILGSGMESQSVSLGKFGTYFGEFGGPLGSWWVDCWSIFGDLGDDFWMIVGESTSRRHRPLGQFNITAISEINMTKSEY